ncbi:unnamed protein product [Pleuronectes platessa]|uniref:Uncharacterized protein n=1 Tax=Pleuronectes platessa TaxID=8262 RepID=A0A9N7VB20_PLEPL|nr:unnamed protein product [Pleuronectes platessa]
MLGSGSDTLTLKLQNRFVYMYVVGTWSFAEDADLQQTSCLCEQQTPTTPSSSARQPSRHAHAASVAQALEGYLWNCQGAAEGWMVSRGHSAEQWGADYLLCCLSPTHLSHCPLTSSCLLIAASLPSGQ